MCHLLRLSPPLSPSISTKKVNWNELKLLSFFECGDASYFVVVVLWTRPQFLQAIFTDSLTTRLSSQRKDGTVCKMSPRKPDGTSSLVLIQATLCVLHGFLQMDCPNSGGGARVQRGGRRLQTKQNDRIDRLDESLVEGEGGGGAADRRGKKDITQDGWGGGGDGGGGTRLGT